MRCGYCSQVITKSGFVLYYCITKSEGFPQLLQRPVLLVREIFQTMMSLPQWKGTLISVDVWLMVWIQEAMASYSACSVFFWWLETGDGRERLNIIHAKTQKDRWKTANILLRLAVYMHIYIYECTYMKLVLRTDSMDLMDFRVQGQTEATFVKVDSPSECAENEAWRLMFHCLRQITIRSVSYFQ